MLLNLLKPTKLTKPNSVGVMFQRCFSKVSNKKPSNFKYAYNYYPANDPSINRTTLFLHGLYGTKEEWTPVASDDKVLEHTNSYTIDAVNHGGKLYNSTVLNSCNSY